ncbi:GGDEF domain-containing protein [Thiobacillus sedimenti]|uniref:diguanylate cyclase n=1 Tax=Thiobacillus sedimenti TaxID=3110231 RepID=A0ABZ1CGC4_9PROT|nr:GGDEF domain-containing protein [Thiobacillus sp. SCUT-2]WRS37961.1 GGDEF domain-containing protein [Thiobacillus sp. SCUT-2]
MNAALLILVVSCCVALAMSGILFIIARTYPKSVQGLDQWTLATLAMAASLGLFVARDLVPDAFSIVLANVLVLGGFMLMNAGTQAFCGVKAGARTGWRVLFVAVYAALFVWLTYVQPDIRLRVAAHSAFTLVVILDQLGLALKALPRTAGRTLLVLALAILAGVRIVRLGGLVLGIDHPTGPFDASMPNLFFVALPAVMLPLATISLIMLATEKLRRDLEFSSRYDDLTQCLNKKAAMQELHREIARARRFGSRLAVMLVDLDHFKAINDSRGHLEGDRVLVEFARTAKTLLREADLLTRFGGDEFLVVLPGTDQQQAARVAQRFHEAARDSAPVGWTVSIGIAEWHDADDTVADLLTRADNALYKSKALGRNQTQAG